MYNFNLKTMRVAKGLTQEELAKRANVSRTVISFIENGKWENIKLSTLEKIAAEFNCKVQALYM